jgi:serine/threonine protein kinase
MTPDATASDLEGINMGSCFVSQTEVSERKPTQPDENSFRVGITLTESYQVGEMPLSLDDFKVDKAIGKGTFGKVFLVTKRDTGDVYAMKCLHIGHAVGRNQQSQMTADQAAYVKVQHPFIVPLCFAFQSSDKLYLVMDFMRGGELFFHLRRLGRFTEDQARFYTAEMVLALEFVHSSALVYRDLKPENILLDREGHLRLSDFGLSIAGVHMTEATRHDAWTHKHKDALIVCEYSAPEILSGAGHDRAVDFWSLVKAT